MSAFLAEDGSPVVSTDDYRAALAGALVQDDAPATSATEPVPAESATETPAPVSTEASTETPAETPPAQTPDELATLRAEMAALRQEQERQRGTYDSNTRQQREALDAAKREAEALRQQNAELAKTRADDETKAFERQRQAWEDQYRTYPDGAEKTAARAWIDAQVMQHEATAEKASAQRLTESFAPVMQQLEGLRAQHTITSYVQDSLGLLQQQGAEQLAAEVGADVAEVRAYLQRPDVAQAYMPIFALIKQAELQQQPVPIGLLAALGGTHKAYWAEKVADRKAAEDRLIQDNQRELVASGATRAEGGGSGTPRKSIETFADVSTEAYAAAMGFRRR